LPRDYAVLDLRTFLLPFRVLWSGCHRQLFGFLPFPFGCPLAVQPRFKDLCQDARTMFIYEKLVVLQRHSNYLKTALGQLFPADAFPKAENKITSEYRNPSGKGLEPVALASRDIHRFNLQPSSVLLTGYLLGNLTRCFESCQKCVQLGVNAERVLFRTFYP